MGVAVEGSDAIRPGAAIDRALPHLDTFNRQTGGSRSSIAAERHSR